MLSTVKSCLALRLLPTAALPCGTNTTSRGDLENVKCDCMALGVIQGHRGPSGDLNPAGKGEGTRK